jgi:hypothetical protein
MGGITYRPANHSRARLSLSASPAAPEATFTGTSTRRRFFIPMLETLESSRLFSLTRRAAGAPQRRGLQAQANLGVARAMVDRRYVHPGPAQ